MSKSRNERYSLLIQAISKMDAVNSIGKSGGKELPEANESDIDIFVFCDAVPSKDTRQTTINGLGDDIDKVTFNDTEGRFWGTIDFVAIDDVEICLMYFLTRKIDEEIDSVLTGERLDKEGNYFYPTGRCASILSMHILYDKTGYIDSWKKKLSAYPQELADTLVGHHIRKINDAEDFNRAVSRKDVLFYHATLDSAIDHFLQALFALNRTFFPSRKRSVQFIKEFQTKPADCADRLLQVVELGAKPETLSLSCELWTKLCDDLAQCAGGSHG